MDRIDLHIEVEPVPFEQLSEKELGESSERIRERITMARSIQSIMFDSLKSVHYNAQMSSKLIRTHCKLQPEAEALLEAEMKKLFLSAPAYDRILKVARTIADLDQKPQLLSDHIAEAIQYRSLDREGWMG